MSSSLCCTYFSPPPHCLALTPVTPHIGVVVKAQHVDTVPVDMLSNDDGDDATCSGIHWWYLLAAVVFNLLGCSPFHLFVLLNAVISRPAGDAWHCCRVLWEDNTRAVRHLFMMF